MVVVYSSAISAFQRDKHQFFSQIKPSNQLTTSVQLVDQRANTLEYSFILNNKQALEDEFNQQFHLLKNQGVGNNEHFWLYCYYCASLLEHFHRAYAQPDKEEHYKQIKTDIKKRLHLPVEEASETEDNQFAQQLHRSFLDGFHAFIDPVCHVSKIREYVAYANLCRIYWVFSRLTITEGLSLAKGGQFLDTFDAILGTHTDVDKVIASIQRPAQILTYFGVGFFLLRFMIDAGVLLKHTFYPSELEQGADRGCEVNKMQHLPGAVSIEAYRSSYILVDNAQDNPSLFYVPKEGPVVRLTEVTTKLAALTEQLKTTPTIRLTSEQIKCLITDPIGHSPEQTTSWERFKFELYKRQGNFANDLVWATVNFLTNFKKISGLSDPVAGYLTAAFLVFDISMTFYKCSLAKADYTTKKAQYLAEIAQYQDVEQFKGLSAEERLAHIGLLNKQLVEAELAWNTKEATFYFSAAAAALLMFGFTASILVNPGVLVLGSYFVCTLAVAMYLSTDCFTHYKEKHLRYEQAQADGDNVLAAEKEFESARNEFLFTLTTNTVAPLILATIFAINFPAAVALTVAYSGIKFYHDYRQDCDRNTVKELADARVPLEPELEFEEWSCASNKR